MDSSERGPVIVRSRCHTIPGAWSFANVLRIFRNRLTWVGYVTHRIGQRFPQKGTPSARCIQSTPSHPRRETHSRHSAKITQTPERKARLNKCSQTIFTFQQFVSESNVVRNAATLGVFARIADLNRQVDQNRIATPVEKANLFRNF